MQSVGSAATLLITITLAHIGGPQVQGRFGLVKAEVDFLTSLCLIGLPQAAFYFCQRGDLSAAAARRLVVIQACIAGGAVLLWKAFSVSEGREDSSPGFIAASYALAIVATAAYSIVRGISLAYRSSREFALYSAAPSILLLGSVILILVVASDWRAPKTDVAFTFAAAYGVCAVLGYRWILPGWSRERVSLSIPLLRRLVSYGGATWLVGVSQAACLYAALFWIERRAGGVESAGIFAAGLALILVAITPINLVAPILFKRWTGTSARIQHREFVEIGSAVVGGALAVALIMAFWGSPIVGFLLGQTYKPYASIFALLSLGVVPECFLRLWGVRYNAAGRPGFPVWLEMFRFLALSVGLVAVGTSLNHVVWIWLSAEFATLGLGLLLAARIKLNPMSN